MRYKETVNRQWYFTSKEELFLQEINRKDGDRSVVNLPHTYNHLDGQDGGANYYRGKTMYQKQIARPDVAVNNDIYLEFEGVNSVAVVYAWGKPICEHRGGYSAFRVKITEQFRNGYADIAVLADNTIYSDVYPQMADFTFYGGIYRDVNLIAVPKTHFCLDFYGAPGMAFDYQVQDGKADIHLKAWISNPQTSDFVQFLIIDQEGNTVSESYVPAADTVRTLTAIEQPHLWQGVADPYLYQVIARVIRHNEIQDEIQARMGIRTFHVDPDTGFYLNGISTPLRGVSRHQDQLGKGNALQAEDHWSDARMIAELGVNTVRLAHYQHNQTFYEACDALGFVVWAEIPFISVMNKDAKGHENCRKQLKELVYQNYNHPSICFWGISNEITIGGEVEGLQENLEDLNKLVKEIDPGRLTTMAQVSMVPMESSHNQITDVVGYNHYFGWYGGSYAKNEEWLDEFHRRCPMRPIGISEYGCEGIVSWHSDKPECRDYTEEYQAEYHEHMARIIAMRPYLWATHIWNMFDFGCDARDEGGVAGRNNKGLVTFDRKIKKDSYYVYKAYWSKEPFVHITGRRYSDRPYETMAVKVYSNLPEVTLYINQQLFRTIASDKVFVFEGVMLEDEYTVITAKAAGAFSDTTVFRRVKKANPGYVMPLQNDDVAGDGVKNWFDDVDINREITTDAIDENYYSIHDRIGELMNHETAQQIIIDAFNKFGSMKVNKGMFGMTGGLKLEDLSGMLTQDFQKGEKLMQQINQELQKLKK